MSPMRKLLTMAGVMAITATGLLATAAGSTHSAAAYKIVIGTPVATPAKAVAGKPFSVAYKVTRSDTGKPLTTGAMICDPSVAGKTVAHTESFKKGLARLAFTVPSSAKLLKVKVMIKSGGRSATKVSSFAVTGGVVPAASVADATVVEGNSGTATLSFPVTLSAKSTDAVSVDYTTADGTANTPADYAAASGTLTFNPGETAKTIPVTVVGEVTFEPDETLTVMLSKPVNGTIADGSAIGTITNDDTLATPGNYTGKTSQNETVTFEVLPTGTQLRNFRLSDVNLSCKPANLVSVHAPGTVLATTPVPITADGAFSIIVADSGVDGTTTWKDDIKVAGRFSAGATASGSFEEVFSVDFGWFLITCTAPNVTWSAAKAP